jgi:Spy/CpxP family protein refolding chaperone
MKKVTLAISALAVLTFSAGVAAAQMEPIPNPPESHHMMTHHSHKVVVRHHTQHTPLHHHHVKADEHKDDHK